MKTTNTRVTPEASVDRARRFHIDAPLRYRTCGEQEWHEGKIENISWSGMLFRGKQVIEPCTPIEMSFVLPAKVRDELPALVLCSGRVVRHVKPSTDDGLLTLGARILNYRLVRRPSGLH